MTNYTKESLQNKDAMSFFVRNKKYITSKNIIWLSVFVFGVYLYFDDTFRQVIKDALWAIIY